jgi:HPt (histidine-containing phosphotransfer) domain-containing protein
MMVNTMDDIVNVAALMDRLDGDRELLRELIGLYLEDEPSLIDQMAAAVSAGDAPRLARSAHTLKGSVGNFCAPAAHGAAAALELAGREGRVDDAPVLFDRLLGELDRVRHALRSLAEAQE